MQRMRRCHKNNSFYLLHITSIYYLIDYFVVCSFHTWPCMQYNSCIWQNFTEILVLNTLKLFSGVTEESFQDKSASDVYNFNPCFNDNFICNPWIIAIAGGGFLPKISPVLSLHFCLKMTTMIKDVLR